jgi:hypothetical protein
MRSTTTPVIIQQLAMEDHLKRGFHHLSLQRILLSKNLPKMPQYLLVLKQHQPQYQHNPSCQRLTMNSVKNQPIRS